MQKHSKTKLAWFSRFLSHLARKRGGLQCSRDHRGQLDELWSFLFVTGFQNSLSYRFTCDWPCAINSWYVDTFIVFSLMSGLMEIIFLYYICTHVVLLWHVEVTPLDWDLSGRLTTLLQCFDTVGWVIRPVKHCLRNDLNCVKWDVKPCSVNQSWRCHH